MALSVLCTVSVMCINVLICTNFCQRNVSAETNLERIESRSYGSRLVMCGDL